MRSAIISLAIVGLCVTPGTAETLECGTTGAMVLGGTPSQRTAVCEAVGASLTLFDQCNVRAIPTDLRIEIVDQIDASCVGVYHCGEARIEILSPVAIAAILEPDSIYASLQATTYFKSVIVHELAHAAYDAVPCGFQSCVATAEYVAYAMQFLSLTPQNRALIGANSYADRLVLRDEINAMIVFLAPDVFAQKVWSHFNQQADPCGFMGFVMEGGFYFDHDFP